MAACSERTISLLLNDLWMATAPKRLRFWRQPLRLWKDPKKFHKMCSFFLWKTSKIWRRHCHLKQLEVLDLRWFLMVDITFSKHVLILRDSSARCSQSAQNTMKPKAQRQGNLSSNLCFIPFPSTDIHPLSPNIYPSTECVRTRVHAKQDAIHRNGASHPLDIIDVDDKYVDL